MNVQKLVMVRYPREETRGAMSFKCSHSVNLRVNARFIIRVPGNAIALFISCVLKKNQPVNVKCHDLFSLLRENLGLAVAMRKHLYESTVSVSTLISFHPPSNKVESLNDWGRGLDMDLATCEEES